MASRRWLGIDFSGDVKQWARRRTSNIWVAEVLGEASGLVLADLRPVQNLEGEGTPFERLLSLLRGNFTAAAIDAPFSVPANFVQNHSMLLEKVAKARPTRQPFASGSDFVVAVAGQKPPLNPPKPLRATEAKWQGRRVNVRSTLWVTPRGGAPMTSACLTLLALARQPVWPFSSTGPPLLVEAFPAGQLLAWGLPHQVYGKTEEGAEARKTIVRDLRERLHLGRFEEEVRRTPDALDAVIAAFGAVAVTEGQLFDDPGPTAPVEGWIAVHR